MAPKKEDNKQEIPVNGKVTDYRHDKDAKPQENVMPFRQRISSWRWMTTMIVWFGFINATLMRNSFNMALVCMTGSSPKPRVGDNSSYFATSGFNDAQNSTNATAPDPSEGEFDWDEETQGIILSSLLYFGFLAPAISGVLSKKFGPKRIVGISLTISSVMNVLTPFGARAHLYVLLAMRIVIGCFSGTIMPATQALWGNWAPDQEKVQIVSWTLSGVNIGSLVSSLISGYLCTIPLDNGWPFVFYFFGGVSVIWCIVWWTLVYDTPEDHPWISEKEKLYIADNIKAKPDKSTYIPYKAVMTSVPMWAFVFIQTVHMWCATIFFTYLPKYMRDILRFPIELNAIVSSVPFASRFVGVLFWGIIADHMSKKRFSTTTTRKVVQSAGFLACAALTTGIGFITEEKRVYGVLLFVITMFFQSCTFASSSVVPLDMAPRLASVITGVFMGAGAFVAIFAPITVSVLTPDGTLEQWRNVFFMLIGCYVVGVTVFDIFGSAELQPWGKPLPVDNIVNVPSTSQLPEVDKPMQDGACANGHISHDDDADKPRRPRILIEREVSVVSTDSFKSHKSNSPGSPLVRVTSVYFYDENKDEAGNVNYGYVDEEIITQVTTAEVTNRDDVNIWYANSEDISVRNEMDEVTRL